MRNADQDNNSGVEAAHFTEGSAEGAARAGSRFQYGRKLRQYKKLERLEKKADKDAVDSILSLIHILGFLAKQKAYEVGILMRAAVSRPFT